MTPEQELIETLAKALRNLKDRIGYQSEDEFGPCKCGQCALVTSSGEALAAYDEYAKVKRDFSWFEGEVDKELLRELAKRGWKENKPDVIADKEPSK